MSNRKRDFMGLAANDFAQETARDRLWAAPDPMLIDAGAHGELLVAKVRIALVSLVLLIPIYNVIATPYLIEAWVGLVATLAALVFAVVIWGVVRRGFYRPWLGFMTSAVDVTFVTATLVAFLAMGTPHVAVNSRIMYSVYFFSIGASSLRYDTRICIVTGALAVVQYAAVVVAAGLLWDLNDLRYAPFTYGMVSWGDQIGRLILLATSGVLATAIVDRSRQLRHLSALDRLTGLLNRGYFETRYQAEVARARRHGHPLAVALLDLDRYKNFNDRYGHASGDVALRVLADTLLKGLRATDIVARYGGDEFVVLLPETSPGAAFEKMEQLRLAVARAEFAIPRHDLTAQITLSAGIASLPDDGTDPVELLEVADQRLFAAKDGGRNRVVGPQD
ncbi:MAG: GGDEF domain-containing protein [Gemmatimonadales bacterium]